MPTRVRNADHLREHLSAFEAEYPVKTGYVARLLIVEGLSVHEVSREVRIIVQARNPDKLVHKGSLNACLYNFRKSMVIKRRCLTTIWPSLITLFLKQFPISFISLPAIPDFSPPGQSSHMQHHEPPSVSPSATLLEQDTPQTSTQDSAPVNLHSASEPCSLSSPKKLKGDCTNCVAQKRKVMAISQENVRLKNQIREMKAQHRKDQVPLKKWNQGIKRKTEKISQLKTKIENLNKQYDLALKSLKTLDSLQKKVDGLKVAFNYNAS